MKISLQLLGPVEVHADDRRIKLGPRKQRLVLAILALEVNRHVEVARIVDLAWPGGAPRTAGHAVRVCISALRSAFAELPGVSIQTRGSGYAMVADPMAIDVHLFRSLVSQARAVPDDISRAALLQRALDLWVGAPLAGAAEPETQQRLVAGLEEARLVAQEDLVQARLSLGDHRDLLDTLTGLVVEHPQRERLVQQLMLALYRCGRQAEALAVYRRARQGLAEELGLDPSQDLQRLELAILRGDPGLAVPKPQGAPQGDDVPETAARIAAQIVGRTNELARLDRMLAATRQGQSQCLVIRGAPGVGKTALLEYLAAHGEDPLGAAGLWCGVRVGARLLRAARLDPAAARAAR